MEELHSRGESLAESFFAKRDRELMEKLREELSNEQNRAALKCASGIQNDAVLQGLIDHGITPQSLAAVALIPLVVVAWADREMAPSEKDAILQAATDAGVATGSGAYEVLESWLKSRPGEDLLTAWKNYIAAIKENLDPAATSQLKHSVMTRATEVAESAGGYLGLVSKISAVEQTAIDDLKASFE